LIYQCGYRESVTFCKEGTSPPDRPPGRPVANPLSLGIERNAPEAESVQRAPAASKTGLVAHDKYKNRDQPDDTERPECSKDGGEHGLLIRAP